MSLAQGEDLEALLHNLQLTEWSSRSHFRSLIGDLYNEPQLATDSSQPKVGRAIRSTVSDPTCDQDISN